MMFGQTLEIRNGYGAGIGGRGGRVADRQVNKATVTNELASAGPLDPGQGARGHRTRNGAHFGGGVY